jgi:hypothetical protein
LSKTSRELVEGLKPWEVRMQEFQKKRDETIEEKKRQ